MPLDIFASQLKLLDALGIDYDRDLVKSVDIHIGVADLPTITVTRLVSNEDADALAEAVTAYHLIAEG